MIRRPPRSTLDRSSAASDVYKRQAVVHRDPLALGLDELVANLLEDLHVARAGLAAHIADREMHDVGHLGHDAVSYTHLRAHETVLDLVCRLLLEQKQKTILESNYPLHTQ